MIYDDLISVIIPAYNTGENINYCIESIINQTYTNLEIIVVNDGSTDNTPQIVSKYLNDKRIRMYTIENEGVSHARAFGFGKSTGNYISFIDSDDYLDKHYYEYMINTMFATGSDVVMCGSVDVENYMHEESNDEISMNEVIKKENICLEFLKMRFNCCLWDKLYSRKVFENIDLKVKYKYNEDLYINSLLLTNANSIAIINNKLYKYYQRENSASTQTFSEVMCKDIYEVAIQIYDKMKCQYGSYAKQFLMKRCYMLYYLICSSKKYKDMQDEKKLIIKTIKQNYVKINFQLRKDMILYTLIRYCSPIANMLTYIYFSIKGRN